MQHPTGHGIFPRDADPPAEAAPSEEVWNSQPVKTKLDVLSSHSPAAQGSFLQGEMSENAVPSAAHPSLFTPNA